MPWEAASLTRGKHADRDSHNVQHQPGAGRGRRRRGGGLGIGGAIENQGIAVVSCTTFTGNLARGGAGITSDTTPFPGFGYGGAISNEHGGSLTLTQCTFDENQAVGGRRLSGSDALVGIGTGGALANGAPGEFLAPTLVMIDCTLTSNQAIGGVADAGVDGGRQPAALGVPSAQPPR
jgi:hypothetical protein